ncbi:hypothetical protein [uncultured Alistipes sp.]|uniref:hypothetical protein n=1 Tax=uncultured Alistipes sp. TaxID=538949 RepID=UPI002630A5D9|nr:hypothetical protein [uncultured Alistipes sp.]
MTCQLSKQSKAIIGKYAKADHADEDYVFPVYTEKHVTDKQKMGRRSSFSTLVSETLDKVCEILGIDEKMTWYTARGTLFPENLMPELQLPTSPKWPATAPGPSRNTTTRIPSRKNCASA